MKKICLLFILLSSLVTQANDADSTNRKLEIGFFYLYSTINESAGFFSYGSNFPLGFNSLINIHFTDKISVETGLNYKYKRIEEIGIAGNLYPGEVLNYIEFFKINILELPIKFKFYSLKKSKLSFCFICGITNSFYVKKSVSLETGYRTGYERSQNTKYYNLIVNFGIGGQYNINKKIGILFEPSIGYFAVGGMQEYGVIELKTGVVYHF